MTLTGGTLTGGAGGGGTIDNVDNTHIPVKLAGAFENSPLHWSGIPGESVISDETIEVPAGSVQVGEGMKMSAAGVIPLFNSLLTGKTYIPAMFEYDIATGYNKPFMLDMSLPELLVVQPDFSTSTPLIGTFNNTVTASEFIVSLGIKTNASATLTNVRMEFVSQTTGEPIYFFPSKAGWNADEGLDLVADAVGDVLVDFGDSPLGLLEGEVIIVNYKIDAGVLLGDGAIPYQAVTRKVATFTDVITELEYATESISTSLIYGGEITEATPTTFNITETKVRVTSINQATGKPTVNTYVHPEQLGVTVTDIATTKITRIGHNAIGLVQLDFELTPSVIRENAISGFLVHPSGTIAEISNDGLKSQELYSQIVDGYESLGVTRKKGLAITPYAGLSLSKSAGILHSPGAGVGSGNAGQNIVEIVADPTGSTFSRILQDGTIESSATTDLDPGNWDDGGVLTSVPQPNDATIVYIYQAINDATGGLFIAYGQRVYPDLQDAEINADTDPRVIPLVVEQRTNLLARIAIKSSATNLSLTDEAVFLPGAKFGVALTGGSAASGSGGGDVSGPASSPDKGIATYSGVDGKVLNNTSGIIAENGAIQRVLTDDSLWLKGTSSSPVIIGRQTDITGAGSNTRVVLSESSTNGVALLTLGNNSQYIEFIKAGVSRGAFGTNRDRNAISLFQGPNTTSSLHYFELRTNNKAVYRGDGMTVGGTTTGNGRLQSGNNFSDNGSFNETIGCPIVATITVDNGGNTPALPESALILTRSGVSGEAYGNVARFDISRFENTSTDSRTQLDLRLSNIKLADEGNNTPIIASFRSDHTMLLGSLSKSHISMDTTNITINCDDDINLDCANVFHNGVPIGTRRTSSIRLLKTTNSAIPMTAGMSPVNFVGFENAIVDGSVITPNLSGSIYGVPINGLYRVSLDFWVDRFSGTLPSTFDVQMNRGGFDDIEQRDGVVGIRCRFEENGKRQHYNISRTIRLTTSQTMQFRVGKCGSPVTIYGSEASPITVSYDRIDD